jgi:aryl-alcohol dehydrogenase-like predicted oxidoreductase
MDQPLPTRSLGRTGESVSLVGLGGFHLGQIESPGEAVRLVRAALDGGMTFLDNSWDYHDGTSEERMGQALADGYRERAFLMTKIDGRTRRAATSQLEQSLRRLRTDRVDLLQFHEIIRMADADRIFSPGGALEAAVEARHAGKVRFIGFTGHKDPRVHLHMLEVADRHGFPFDTVQLPLNVMDAHLDGFERLVLPVLQARGLGVLGMKPLSAGLILESGAATAVECLHYAMNLPTSVVITGCDSMDTLRQALDAARSFRPLPADRVAALLARTAAAGREERFESYKTTAEHDSTSQHPEWLG